MNVTTEAAVWVVSPEVDDELYEQAMRFVAKHPGVDPAQWSSLLAYAERWQDVQTFVERQGARAWEQKGHYKAFFLALHQQLGLVAERARTMLPPDLSTDARREQLPALAGPMARAFLQHLCAEALWTAPRDRR